MLATCNDRGRKQFYKGYIEFSYFIMQFKCRNIRVEINITSLLKARKLVTKSQKRGGVHLRPSITTCICYFQYVDTYTGNPVHVIESTGWFVVGGDGDVQHKFQ